MATYPEVVQRRKGVSEARAKMLAYRNARALMDGYAALSPEAIATRYSAEYDQMLEEGVRRGIEYSAREACLARWMAREQERALALHKFAKDSQRMVRRVEAEVRRLPHHARRASRRLYLHDVPADELRAFLSGFLDLLHAADPFRQLQSLRARLAALHKSFRTMEYCARLLDWLQRLQDPELPPGRRWAGELSLRGPPSTYADISCRMPDDALAPGVEVLMA
jgi:hypothetical protein